MKTNQFIAAVLLTYAHSFASAVGAYCTYKVAKVSIEPGGTVAASLTGQSGSVLYTILCNVDLAYAGISPSVCKPIYALLLVAKNTQQDTGWWFDSPTAFSCSSPSWIQLKSLGWYYGPIIE